MVSGEGGVETEEKSVLAAEPMRCKGVRNCLNYLSFRGTLPIVLRIMMLIAL